MEKIYLLKKKFLETLTETLDKDLQHCEVS